MQALRVLGVYLCVGLCIGLGAVGAAQAQQAPLSYNLYGLPGGIEMPTAQAAPDAELGFSFSYGGESLRNTLSFQITPRLSGAFRYSRIGNWFPGGAETYDRSFDLRYQILDETPIWPALAIGMQDFIGTGIYSAEYLVATKNLGPVTATAGLGWGRLGSYQPIGRFGQRPTGTTGTGGQLETTKWFRGDVAPFGGLSWTVNDRLLAKVEYSSDAQLAETARGHFTRSSPFNFGIDYRLGQRSQLSAYLLHGSEFGVMFRTAFDPKNSPAGPSRESAPLPVKPRAPGSAADLGWVPAAPQLGDALIKGLDPVLRAEGIVLEGLVLAPRRATIRIRNLRYPSQAQAAGRVARILSNLLPGSIETFEIIPMLRGLAGSKILIRRSQLERLENAPNAAAQMLAVTPVEDAADVARQTGINPDVYPKFTWELGPYVSASLFDPEAPFLVDAGLELAAEWNPSPGFYLSGLARARVLGNKDSSDRFSNSILPHVRSDANFYAKEDIYLDHLTAAYFFRPGRNLYGRVSAGYLERMYGGVSAEVLWKPVHSRFALGAELNYAAQRSFDGLGFEPLTITAAVNHGSGTDTIGPARRYDVVTGHVSAYYAFENDFHMQLDLGRYLAGDWGGTISLDREFNNGWRVGAYATLTDVPFDDFGEGSFDKGIRLTIPLGWQTGQASRRVGNVVLQPLTRDGGARLKVQDRLYEVIRDSHSPILEGRWGRFWR